MRVINEVLIISSVKFDSFLKRNIPDETNEFATMYATTSPRNSFLSNFTGVRASALRYDPRYRGEKGWESKGIAE